MYQQIGALQAEVGNLKRKVEGFDLKLDTLLEDRAKQRGGRGMLWKVGTISGSVGALAMSFAQWWSTRGN